MKSFWLVLMSICMVFCLALHLSCGASRHQIAHVAIVESGDVVQQLVIANRAQYFRTVANVPGNDLERYEREYDKRLHALAAISSALYLAAAINDNPLDNDQNRRLLASQALSTIEDNLNILFDGTLIPSIELTTQQRNFIHLSLETLNSIVGLPNYERIDASAE